MVDWITDQIGVHLSAVNIGIINHDKTYLIDTGIDNSAINKVMKELDVDIDGAIITHHHADHMGGCSKLNSLGISNIYGPQSELELFMKPYLEPFTMFSGGFPPKKLRNRHLEAKPVSNLKNSDDIIEIEVINSPGHSPGHTSYLFNDILLLGDAAFTYETINKYKLLFAVNPKQAVESLNLLMKSDFNMIIPGHGPVIDGHKSGIDLLKQTQDHFNSIRSVCIEVIGEKLNYNKFVSSMLKELNLIDIVKKLGVIQYFLYQSPLMGYLSNLLDDKILTMEPDDGGLLIVTT